MKKLMLLILGAMFSFGIMSCDNCYNNKKSRAKKNYRKEKRYNNKYCCPKEQRDDRKYKIERGQDW
jgi:hypothetical protein